MQLVNPNKLWKNGVKQMESPQLVAHCIFHPVAKDPGPSSRVKVQQKLLFGILTSMGASTHAVS